MKILLNEIEFQWDKGNIDKNLIKHQITNEEAEEIFFDRKRCIFKDELHSNGEKRHRILGKTKKKRLLFAVFTARNNKIRIISVRDINKKEAYLYEKTA